VVGGTEYEGMQEGIPPIISYVHVTPSIPEGQGRGVAGGVEYEGTQEGTPSITLWVQVTSSVSGGQGKGVAREVDKPRVEEQSPPASIESPDGQMEVKVVVPDVVEVGGVSQ
jgi:hypothetical protein